MMTPTPLTGGLTGRPAYDPTLRMPAGRGLWPATRGQGWFVLTTALLTALATTQGGTLTSNFSTDPGGAMLVNRADITALVRDGTLKLVDLNDLIDPGTGQYNEQRLPLQGSYIFPEIDPGKLVGAFDAAFKARVGGGTENGALGFGLVLANDYPTTTPFREGGGSTTGLTISFLEAVGQGGIAEYADQSYAPGIVIKQGGQVIMSRRFTGLRTDPGGTNHPPVFVPVEVLLTADGLLTVTYNTNKVYDGVAIGYIPITGQFGFGAGIENQTAIVRDNFWIKDLSISTTPVTGAYVVSVTPPALNASADAAVSLGVQGLTGAVQMQFDGNTVTTATSDAGGGVTLVTYRPANLLAPGSAHTVKLTYAGKVFQYGFTVANAPILPPTATAPAGSVDTTKTGFTVRVYQVDAPQSVNSAARAEKELAGLLGPNTATPGPNPDGSYFAEVINFSHDGNQAGDISGDTLIPGIPGTATNATDNIAMEVTGFLDLKPGAYTIGAVSDDSLKFSIGADPRDITALTLFDITIGRATAPVVVQQAGIYPFRVLWTQGSGPANLELWSRDASGTEMLLNDAASAGSIKSYRQRASGYKAPPYLSAASPGPAEVNVSTLPTIQLVLADGATTINQSSISLSLNGAPVTIPSSAVAKTNQLTTIKFSLTQALLPNQVQALALQFADSAGTKYTRQYVFTTGKGGGGNPLIAVKGYWTFGTTNLKARIGRDLRFVDPTFANRYTFGVTGQGDFAAIPGIKGQPTRVLKVPYLTSGDDYKHLGLRLAHNLAPNGGGKKVNQYTVILDILWGQGSGYGAVWQLHDLDNPGDSDMYWQESTGAYGKACCSAYVAPNQKQARNEWRRVVFAVDLAANPPVLAKYIDGIKNLEQITGDRGHLDSAFALSVPEIVLFGDSDNENSDAYVSAVQVREGRLSDEDVAALGPADPNGIPLPWSQWDFNPAKPLAATVGNDLEYVDPAFAAKYTAGVTGQGDFAAVPGIKGQPTAVFKVPYLTGGDDYKHLGLRLRHGLAPNGGGAKVNQFTVILDIMWGQGSGYGALWQLHDLDNPGDSDMYWQESTGAYGKACCSAYVAPNQKQARNEWRRVAFAVDLAANPPILAKYIDGIKNLEQITGDRGHIDSAFALSVPAIVLFGDSDNENSDAYISHLQVRQGRLSDADIAALGPADPAGIPTPNPVKGEWNFDPANPLAATIGAALQYVDPNFAGSYKAGVTGQGDFVSIPGINNKPTHAFKVPYLTTGDDYKHLGLRLSHGIRPNGGGAKVNQFTAILDIFWGQGSGYGALWQLHDLDNPGDSDMYWQESTGAYGKACCSAYVAPNQKQARNEWRRVAFAVDLAATPPILAKYIDGIKNLEQITGDRGHTDSAFALSVPAIVLFGDSDNENSDAYVSAIQFREGRMSDDEIAALGGADADGIPGASIGATTVTAPPPPVRPRISISRSGANVTLTWDTSATGFTLESKDDLNAASWTTVSSPATSPFSVQAGATRKYYRLRK